MTSEEIKAKIKKLLALGKSPNEHEARRALAKAQELMLKYNIYETGTEQEQSVYSKRIKFWRGRYLTQECWIMAQLVKEFRCLPTDVYSHRGAEIEIFGNGDDVEIAVEALEFAWKCMNNCWRDYFKVQSPSRRQKRGLLKKSYCVGFYNGVVTHLKASVQEYGLLVVIQDNVKKAVAEMDRQQLIRMGVDPDKQITPSIAPERKSKPRPKLDSSAVTNGYLSGLHSQKKDQLTVF